MNLDACCCCVAPIAARVCATRSGSSLARPASSARSSARVSRRYTENKSFESGEAYRV